MNWKAEQEKALALKRQNSARWAEAKRAGSVPAHLRGTVKARIMGSPPSNAARYRSGANLWHRLVVAGQTETSCSEICNISGRRLSIVSATR